MTVEFENLQLIKDLQKQAYDSVQEVQSQLVTGITEKETADLMTSAMKRRGIKKYFHRPFAWFGKRTAFRNFTKPLKGLPDFKNPLPHFGSEFLPTDSVLRENTPVILDVAPTRDSFAVDIGYSFFHGESEEHQKALEYLKEIRIKILELVKADCSIGTLYKEIENDLVEKGYTNCHGYYPLGVLGHRIGKLPGSFLPGLSLMGFEPQAYAYLLSHLKEKPFLKENEDAKLEDGLWAIEPHIGTDDFGVKFEEILVKKDGEIYWLDDSLPHTTGL